MDNPFVFGRPVKGGSFIDREKETRRLVGYMQSSQNAIIYSPRKYGKTSLVLRAMEATEDALISIFIDCYAITSEAELGRRISSAVLSHYRHAEILDAVGRLFSGLVPRVTIKTVPEVQLEVEWDREGDWREALELPERLAADTGRRVVVVFDEFQELGRFDGLLKTLRAAFQHHSRTSYLFIGSKRHMMEWIFRNRESPFYNFGAHITLREIPADEFRPFILDAFARAEVPVGEEVVDRLLALTGSHPYYTQRLCFDLWYRGIAQGRITAPDLDAVVSETIADLEDSYIAIWDLLTPNQRKALLAVAGGETDLYSGDFIRKWEFASPASVQSAMRKLLEREVVSEEGGRYLLADVFLGAWLRKRFLEPGSRFIVSSPRS
jgi:AAA+ ATPase superfamily predicted ATPase